MASEPKRLAEIMNLGTEESRSNPRFSPKPADESRPGKTGRVRGSPSQPVRFEGGDPLVKSLLLSHETGRTDGKCWTSGAERSSSRRGCLCGTKLSNFFRNANLSRAVGIVVEANSCAAKGMRRFLAPGAPAERGRQSSQKNNLDCLSIWSILAEIRDWLGAHLGQSGDTWWREDHPALFRLKGFQTM
jgi:hypothetical protein